VLLQQILAKIAENQNLEDFANILAAYRQELQVKLGKVTGNAG
jgi:hypothetical protein